MKVSIMLKKIASVILCATALGCASRVQPAPIENATNIPGYIQPSAGVTYPAPAPVAATPPTTQMGALTDTRKTTPTPAPAPVQVAKTTPPPPPAGKTKVLSNNTQGEWAIPTLGTTEGFTASSKGVDIYGTQGQPIVAINDGKVVYSGNGLKGYGNLIIVKHSDSYLSAYAHNKVNLVKEGAVVKRGQKIAEMGTDDSGKAVLHLEVRKNGKPIDPFSVIKTK